MLAEKLLKHCDNLSRTIQSSSMPAVEAHRLSELCIRVFQKMRDDEDFDLFWALTQQTQKQLDVNDPILQRQRKRPRRYEDGSASPFFFSDPKAYYRSMFFQFLDAVITAITDRFHQHDYSIYANLEQVLIKACTHEDYSKELEEVTQFFNADFDKSLLKTQLELLRCMDIEKSGQSITFHDIHKHFQSVPHSQVLLLSQVALVVKFVLLMPATNAVSERSASAMRRIKSYLRTTMTQSRMNNIMVLHIHRHLTDSIDHIRILNEFVSANDDRRKNIGLYS